MHGEYVSSYYMDEMSGSFVFYVLYTILNNFE